MTAPPLSAVVTLVMRRPAAATMALKSSRVRSLPEMHIISISTDASAGVGGLLSSSSAMSSLL